MVRWGMDLRTAHRLATRQVDNRVKVVRPDQWDNDTPCTGWSVRDLVGHLARDQRRVPGLLAGETVAAVDDLGEGDAPGADPAADWATSSAAAVAAWNEPGAPGRTVQLPRGEVPATDYLRQLVVTLTVHAWDLSRGIGVDDEMPNDLVGVVVQLAREHRAELAGSGLMGAPLDTSACADDLTELLALVGRARWKKAFQPLDFRGPDGFGS